MIVTVSFCVRSAGVPSVVFEIRALPMLTFTSLLVVRSWTVMVSPLTATIWPAAAGALALPAAGRPTAGAGRAGAGTGRGALRRGGHRVRGQRVALPVAGADV